MSETPDLDPGVVYSLFEVSTSEVLAQIVPLLAEKHANFSESGASGLAFFFKQKLPLLAVSLNDGHNSNLILIYYFIYKYNGFLELYINQRFLGVKKCWCQFDSNGRKWQ